jgi:hypothetical protein
MPHNILENPNMTDWIEPLIKTFLNLKQTTTEAIDLALKHCPHLQEVFAYIKGKSEKAFLGASCILALLRERDEDKFIAWLKSLTPETVHSLLDALTSARTELERNACLYCEKNLPELHRALQDVFLTLEHEGLRGAITMVGLIVKTI